MIKHNVWELQAIFQAGADITDLYDFLSSRIEEVDRFDVAPFGD
jgi:hypothetical protein